MSVNGLGGGIAGLSNSISQYPGGSSGQGGCPSGYYPYNGLCYVNGWQTNDNNDISTAYTFNTAACTAGASVGLVSLNGANSFSISSSNFLISSTGLITLNSALTAGTYYLTISGYTYNGNDTGSTLIVSFGFWCFLNIVWVCTI